MAAHQRSSNCLARFVGPVRFHIKCSLCTLASRALSRASKMHYGTALSALLQKSASKLSYDLFHLQICLVWKAWLHLQKCRHQVSKACAFAGNQENCGLRASESFTCRPPICRSLAQEICHPFDAKLNGILFWLRVPSSTARQFCSLQDYGCCTSCFDGRKQAFWPFTAEHTPGNLV